MSKSQAVVARVEEHVATLTLNRPDRLNVINSEMTTSLRDAIASLTTRDLRAVVLRAEGRAFCAGGDIAAMAESAADLPSFVDSLVGSFHECILALRALPCPVIASVQGAAAGGGFSLAMACDFIVAERSASFVVAYPKLATSSDGGLSFFLARRVGAARALSILLLSDRMSAEEAHVAGLIDVLADEGRLHEATLSLVHRLVSLPTTAVHSMRGLLTKPEEARLREQLAREKESFVRCAGESEFHARVMSFVRWNQESSS